MARDGGIETMVNQISLAFAPEIRLSLGTPQYSPFISQSNFISPVLSPNLLTHAQLRKTKVTFSIRSFSPPLFIICIYFYLTSKGLGAF